MKIEFDIPDEKIKEVVEHACKDNSWWVQSVREMAQRSVDKYIREVAIEPLVKSYLDSRIASILDDVVYRQVRHVVKLAVDKELAIAREVSEINNRKES